MKRALIIFISLALVIFMTSCSVFEVIEYTGENGAVYFYDYSDGIKTVTNYHPYKFWDLPSYQEMVQYGEGAGLENGGVVYYIYVVDTSIDADDESAYYCAELDGETKELLCEEGAYFSDEAEKKAVIDRLVREIDSTYFK